MPAANNHKDGQSGQRLIANSVANQATVCQPLWWPIGPASNGHVGGQLWASVCVVSAKWASDEGGHSGQRHSKPH